MKECIKHWGNRIAEATAWLAAGIVAGIMCIGVFIFALGAIVLSIASFLLPFIIGAGVIVGILLLVGVI